MALSQPIAIVGIGCRLPGAVGARQFWEILEEGRETVGVYSPRGLPDLDAVYQEGTEDGRIATRRGGFLEGIDQFDAAFFGISPREAASMDPQQRLLLEVAWETFEAAGIPRSVFAGSDTGVFIGQWTGDYEALVSSAGGTPEFYSTTGTGRYSASGRISFQLDLRGPAVTVDTACSSSLVAVHLACESIRSGACGMALAGGVNVILRPDVTLIYSAAGMLSPDGHCKFGDVSADGYVRSEGAALVLLKPLDAAVCDGDHIHAVIRGSAVNNDGAGNGLLVMPSVEGQKSLIRQALNAAGVAPARVCYIEAHGTGTAVGDPVEIGAIGGVLGQHRTVPCLVGSVKSNIGHTESAAGAAGLIKTALSLEHGRIPASLHLHTPNPAIDWSGLRVRVPRTTESWPDSPVAGVNAFGITGTNAHVLLEPAPARAPRTAPPVSRRLLLPVSAQSPEALHALSAAYARRLEETGNGYDLVYTAALGRTHHRCRLAVSGDSAAELTAALRAPARPAPSGIRPRVVFVFPGQGSQWPGMGRDLLDHEEAFRREFVRCDAAFRAFADWSLLERIQAGEALEEIDAVQPALFAVEVSLAALWRSWGVEPYAVVGHSMGEVAAAYVAGILNLDDAARVICQRSRLLRTISGRGAMAVVDLSVEETRRVLTGHEALVSIAVSNGPRSTVISGDPAAVDEVIDTLERRDVFCRRVKVDVASHSPQVEPLEAPLLAALDGISPRPASLPMYSTVTGTVADGPECGPAYWFRNLRQPVLFGPTLASMLRAGCNAFLELSPHPILLPTIEQCTQEAAVEAVALPSGRRGEPERWILLDSLGSLYECGCEINWAGVYPAPGERVELPTYPWQRERFWIPAGDAAPSPPSGGRRHAVTATGQHIWDLQVGLEDDRFLCDHRVGGLAVVPAAFYLDAALLCGRQVLGSDGLVLEGCQFPVALALPETGRQHLQVLLSPSGQDRFSWRIYAGGDGSGWVLHASGAVARVSGAPGPLLGDTAECGRPGAEFYEQVATRGIDYGPAFRNVKSFGTRGGSASASIEPPPHGRGAWKLTPLLDALLQMRLMQFGEGSETMVPRSIDRFEFLAAPEPGASLAGSAESCDLVLRGPDGAVLMAARGVRFEPAAAPASSQIERLLYSIEWVASRPDSQRDGLQTWVLLAHSGAFATALAARLEALGDTVILAGAGTGCRSLAPDEPGDYRRLWHEIGRPVDGIVHLGALEGGGAEWGALSLAPLVQSFEDQSPPHLFLVTRGAQAAGGSAVSDPGAAALWGAGAVLATELPEWRSTLIDLSPADEAGEFDALLAELFNRDGEDRVALRPQGRFVMRLAHASELTSVSRTRAARPGEGYRLLLPKPGLLDELAFEPCDRVPPGDGEVEVEVRAAGLNFVDVLKAMGLDPTQEGAGPFALGGECAGVVTAAGGNVRAWKPGDEVMVFTPSFARTGCFSAYVTVPADCLTPMPVGLSFEQAAALPLAFLTAYHALVRLARLGRGERILIHSAAGGVGMAAVQLAQAAGADIFATAGTEEKRALLRDLGVRHVFDSRSMAFAGEIMAATGGSGVDVVLNSLTGDAIPASLALLKPYGRFLEIGKRALSSDTTLDLQPFRKSLSFCAIDIARMVEDRRAEITAMMGEIAGLVEAGLLSPLPVTVFSAAGAGDAFRLMAQGRHTGKIVVSFTGAAPPLRERGGRIHSSATYLITGGTGALGLTLARELVRLGARHVVLVSRRGISELPAELRAAGVDVRVACADVASRDQLGRVIEEIRREMPPLRGVFHAAGVLADALLLKMDAARFRDALAPKVDGAWNLHELTAADALDFFVLFSSVAGLLGLPGQANYAAGNAFLDAFASWRAVRGLPALSIQWGPWSGGGLAAAAGRGDRLTAQGLESISPQEGAAVLNRLLGTGATNVAAMRLDTPRWTGDGSNRRLLSALADTPTASTAAAPGVRQALLDLAPGEARAALLRSHVREQVGRVLRLAADRVPLDQPLKTLGLDSLMALELRNRLERSLALRLPATLAFNYPTVSLLVPHLAERLGIELAPPPVAAAPADVATLEAELSAELEAAKNLLRP